MNLPTLSRILIYAGNRLMAAGLALHNPYVAMAEKRAADLETRRRLMLEAEVFGPLHLVDNEEGHTA